MSVKNKILTTLNQVLGVTNLYQINPTAPNDGSGTTLPITVIEGVPIGTSDQSATGELGLKVIVVADRSGGAGSQTVTPNFGLLTGVSASFTIPAGAKGWTYSVLSGTSATVGGIATPVGLSDSDINVLAAGITLVTNDTSTSIYYRYNL